MEQKKNPLEPNEETKQAILDARQGIGLSKGFSTVEELMEDLNREETVPPNVGA